MAGAPLDLLVEPAWLEAHLRDPDLRIVDATWYLPDEKRDARKEYEAAHVPGASHLDISSDLADTTSPLRNTVPEPAELARRFAQSGIGSEHRVVVYDRRAGYSAGRVWWLLRYAGHERAALLDGGFERWLREGRPVTSELPRLPPARFDARSQPRWLRRKADVLRNLEERRALVLDVRSAARFRGEGPEPARRRGHIPGSRNLPYTENFSGDPPALRDRAGLRRLYEQTGVDFGRPVIASCGSGVTASLAAFVLTWIGHPDVAVYDGSWDEWGNSDDVPVES